MKRLTFLAIAVFVLAAACYLFSCRPSPKPPTATPKLPASEKEFKQMPGGAATMDAGEYIISRFKEGTLPGFSKGDHGSMVARNMKPPQEQTEAYPVLSIIRLRKDGDTADYYYSVVRESEGAPLQLQKASRVSPDGKLLEEYPVK